MPAVAQGAIAVECREHDPSIHALVAALENSPTRTCVAAERAMNLELHGSCHVPVAGYATLDGGTLALQGLVGDAANGQLVRADGSGPRSDPQALGRQVAAELLRNGAGEILARS